jgi:ubiquinone/menaquinone biosynthesis C-methylase UbiE
MNKYSYIDFLAEFGINSAHPGGRVATKEIFDIQSIDSKDVLLDVGCGTGETSAYLANRYNCSIYAIETHPLMLKKARARLKNEAPSVHLLEGSIERLPFDNETFDLILIESVLSFVNVQTALHECMRVLKKEGTLILNEMTILEKLSNDDLGKLKAFYHFSECNVESDWKDHLNNTGFTQIEKLNLSFSGNNEENELELRIDMDPQFFDILDKHEALLEEFRGRMGNVVLRCRKDC